MNYCQFTFYTICRFLRTGICFHKQLLSVILRSYMKTFIFHIYFIFVSNLAISLNVRKSFAALLQIVNV